MRSAEFTDPTLPPNWVYHSPEPGSEEEDLLRRIRETLNAENDARLPDFSGFDETRRREPDTCDIGAPGGVGAPGIAPWLDEDERPTLRAEITNLVGERESLKEEVAALETAIDEAESELADVSSANARAASERPVLYAINPIPLTASEGDEGEGERARVSVVPVYDYQFIEMSGRFLDLWM